MKKLGFGVGLVFLVLLVGCGGEGFFVEKAAKKYAGKVAPSFENAKAMVADAKTRIVQIAVRDFMKLEKERKDYLLLDVREPGEFKKGHINNAINLPRGLLEFKVATEEWWKGKKKPMPAKDTFMVIYCKKGGRGALATDSLGKLGYKNVKNIKGGWLQYKAGPEDTSVKDDGGCG